MLEKIRTSLQIEHFKINNPKTPLLKLPKFGKYPHENKPKNGGKIRKNCIKAFVARICLNGCRYMAQKTIFPPKAVLPPKGAITSDYFQFSGKLNEIRIYRFHKKLLYVKFRTDWHITRTYLVHWERYRGLTKYTKFWKKFQFSHYFLFCWIKGNWSWETL